MRCEREKYEDEAIVLVAMSSLRHAKRIVLIFRPNPITSK